MRSIAVLILMGIGLLFALGSALNSVLFYWWYVIFRPSDWIYIDISALRISLVAGVIVLVMCTLTRRFPRVDDSITALILVFFCTELHLIFNARMRRCS